MMMSSPEPMSLGSPTQSPTQNSNVNQYLPQFLIGDHPSRNINQTQMNNSKFWQQPTNSPPRSQFGSHLFQTQSSLSRSYSLNAYDVKPYEKPESTYSQQNPITPLHDRTLGSTSILTSNLNHSQNVPNIPGAPPVNRLADIMSKPSFSIYNTPNDSRTQSFFDQKQEAPSQLKISPPSPTQVDPFYMHGEQIKVDDKLDDTWITVFGFPQSATSYVLQEFSVYGQILRHTSTQGNWLHIQYQTKLQAQKALSKNGKVLANNIMVGVMKCIDKSVVNGQVPCSENIPLPENVSSGPKIRSLGGAGIKLDRSQSLRTGVRPLGLHNRDESSRAPKKNTNVLSKAMEYMFGW